MVPAMSIPAPALLLGLAGLLPFLWGAATVLIPGLAEWGARSIGPRFAGPYVLIAYGTVILSFMSGALWGFAARAEEHRWRGYALSVLPALWVFFMVGGGAAAALSALLVGFLVLLVIEAQFTLWRLTPGWWMPLRLVLSAGVVLCLGLGLWRV